MSRFLRLAAGGIAATEAIKISTLGGCSGGGTGGAKAVQDADDNTTKEASAIADEDKINDEDGDKTVTPIETTTHSSSSEQGNNESENKEVGFLQKRPCRPGPPVGTDEEDD